MAVPPPALPLEPYFAAACVSIWIFYGFRWSWTGGTSFGNRYFSVVAMVLAFFAAETSADVFGS